MQMDADTAAALGFLSSIFTAGISYGMMRVKVDRLEKEIEKTVDKEYLAAVLHPMNRQLNGLEEDVKQILRVVNRLDPAPPACDKKPHK